MTAAAANRVDWTPFPSSARRLRATFRVPPSEPHSITDIVIGSHWRRLLSGTENEGTRDWESYLSTRLAEIMDLEHNWDTYGALPVDVRAAEQLADLLSVVLGDRSPWPLITPTANGSLIAEWHNHGIDFEIRLLPGERFDLMFEDVRNPSNNFELEVAGNLEPIVRALQTLESREPIDR